MKKNFPIEITEKEELLQGYAVERKTVYGFDYHYHDFYEFELILSGSAKVTVNGNEKILTRGDAYLLRPTDLHEFKSIERAEIYSAHFLPNAVEPSVLDAFLSKNGYLTVSFSEAECKLYESLLTSLYGGYDLAYGLKRAQAVFTLIITSMLESGVSVNEHNYDNDIFKAVRYLSNNFTLNPTLSETAKISGLTQTYFCRKFKAVTGKTFIEFLSSLKIEFACRLITGSSLSLADICYASGFNSVSQFIREFKKIKGLTPSELRKNG